MLLKGERDMRTVDFSPLYRTIVGFDRLASLIDAASGPDAGAGYPPYNIEQTGEDAYRIDLAVAGFGQDEIDLEVRDNVLTVSGRKAPADEGRNFLHRGIAERAFERRFHLADHVVVKGAGLENGLLSVELARELPDALKPHKIAIETRSGGGKLLGARKAA
jgi:molecular chaperone IbpA